MSLSMEKLLRTISIDAFVGYEINGFHIYRKDSHQYLSLTLKLDPDREETLPFVIPGMFTDDVYNDQGDLVEAIFNFVQVDTYDDRLHSYVSVN